MKNWKLISFMIVTAALIAVLEAPQAKAAACNDHESVTVDGTVTKIVKNDGGVTWIFMQTPSLDCSPIYIQPNDVKNCREGSTIHASGQLDQPESYYAYNNWSLDDMATNDTAHFNTFSCQ